MRAVMLTAASFALTGVVIGNAYLQKKQFYPSVVYITKSSPSMAVLYIQAFVFVILMGKLMRKIFFGSLRAAEMEHLIERSWYAITETCLAFTVFRDDFSPRFVALFTLLLFLKCFHWLAEDRVEYMERSPVISWLFHFRCLALLSLLGFVDCFFINHAYYSTLIKGASVQLVFGFEYAILFTVVLSICVKYILHTVDLQSENPWENKAVYLLYSDLVMGFVRVVLYMTFMIIMIKVHTFPLFAIRPMYLTIRSFKKALNDVIMSRRAIRNMNTLYPDATIEDIQSGDNVCIICREEMVAGCKKLPCNHIFHTNCLRSWFQRQQTCPTCRMDVLRAPQSGRPQAAQQQQPQGQPQQPNFPGMFQAFPGAIPMWPPGGQPPQPPAWPAGQQPQQQAPVSSAAPSTPTPTTSTVPTSMPGPPPVFTPPGPGTAVPPMMMPPMMPHMPFGMTPPMMPPMPPPNFTGLSEEELRAMEGHERQNLEARIQHLRNIHTLLDASMVMIQQYTNVMASLGPIPAAAAPSSSMPVSSSPSPTSSVDNTVTTSSAQTSVMSTAADLSLPKPITSDSDKKESKNTKIENLDFSDLEGAVGYTPPKVEDIPKWQASGEEEHNDELHEIRKRRLQKFSENKKDNEDSKDNLDLD